MISLMFFLSILEDIWIFYNRNDSTDPYQLNLTQKEVSRFPGMSGSDPQDFMKDVDKNDDDVCDVDEFDNMYYNIFLNNPPAAWW